MPPPSFAVLSPKAGAAPKAVTDRRYKHMRIPPLGSSSSSLELPREPSLGKVLLNLPAHGPVLDLALETGLLALLGDTLLELKALADESNVLTARADTD